MDVIFANPAGWWALLGLPTVLAIHFLQRRSRRVPTSTLFLLEQLAPLSAEGRRIERLRNSIPLWLQLLAVLLIAWLLVQPRWLRSDSVQTVAIVLDSSISMKVWRDAAATELVRRLRTLAKSAARTEWVLTESDLTKPTLYSGGDLAALEARLAEWQPRIGTHDPAPALRVAQSLLREDGVAVFVTDRIPPLPEGVRVLAVGMPFDNVGFIGVRVDGERWTALVRNHGTSPQRRAWRMRAGERESPARELSLAAGQTTALSGSFEPGARRLELVLDSDLFDADDRLPLVRPEPKRLEVAWPRGTPLDSFFQHFADSLPNAVVAATAPDLRLQRYDPLAPAPIEPGAIVFATDPSTSKVYLGGAPVANDHPLVADLSWQGLLCRETMGIPPKPGDEVLLWQGERPLVWLRGAGEDRSLVVNFDLRQSNADRLPAFIVLLNRFAEGIRSRKVARESVNVGTNQQLDVASRPEGGPLLDEAGGSAGGVLRAPGMPGFFTVSQDGAPLLEAAAHFSDPREADFRQASSRDSLGEAVGAQALRNSRADFLFPVWALLLGAVLVASWSFGGRRTP